MDRRFLKEIAEGYITNHDVFSDFKPDQVDLIRETVYSDLCEVCDELRCEDEPFYNTLYFSNRFYQNDVFENYLNIRYKSQSAQTDEVLDEGLGSMAVGTVSLVWKAMTYIMGMSGLAQTAILALFIAAYFQFNGMLAKQFYKLLYGMGNTFKTFGKFIETSGKNFQLRYAVIQKNFDHCYKRAGYSGDLSKIKLLDYWNKGAGSSTVKFGIVDQKEAHKLINCYIETTIAIIQLQIKMYLNCIKSTKGYSEISRLNTTEFMAYIQSDQYKQNEFNLEATCFEYFKIASEQISQFDDLVEYFYKGQSEKRQLTMRLIQSVEQARNEVSRVQQDTRKFSVNKTNPKKNPNSTPPQKPYKKKY